jgi:hypothetical protein
MNLAIMARRHDAPDDGFPSMRLLIGSVLLLLPFRLLEAQRDPRSGASALAVEALGGTVGSLAGVGAGLLLTRAVNECESEDLVCNLRRAATTGVASVVGATVGTYVAGRAADTEPSIVGSLLGAVAGAAAGVGVVHLLTEETNVARNNATLVVAFSVTQGIVTAIGSRIVSAATR